MTDRLGLGILSSLLDSGGPHSSNRVADILSEKRKDGQHLAALATVVSLDRLAYFLDRGTRPLTDHRGADNPPLPQA